MKKILVLLLALLLTVGFSACGGETEATAEEEEESYYDNLEGYTLTYLCGEIMKNTVFGYLDNTYLLDLALSRVKELEQTYNCTIVCNQTETELYDEANRATASGKFLADVYLSSHGPMWAMMRGGSLYPLDELNEQIDLSDYEKWGGPNVYFETMQEEHIYCVDPLYWPLMYPQYYFATVFNTDLVASAGYSDPREAVEKGTWSRELFEEYIVGSAVPEEDVYGITTCTSYLVYMALLSNNADIYTVDENGSCVYALRSFEALNALDWVYGFVSRNSDLISHPNGGGAWGTYTGIFTEGRAAFLLYPLWGIIGQGNFGTTVNMSMDNYGWVPFPNGPSREYGDWASVLEGDSSLHGIASNTEDPDITAFLFNLMYEPFEGLETEEERDAWYLSNLFFDERDYEIFKTQCANARYLSFKEFAQNSANPWAALGNAMATGDYIATIDSIEDSVQKVLDEEVTPNVQALAAFEKEFEEARASR